MIETTDGPDGGAPSCPACRLALRLVIIDELATRQCPGCAGAWLPAEALAEARARRGRAGRAGGPPGGGGPTRFGGRQAEPPQGAVEAPAAAGAPGPACPVCHRTMALEAGLPVPVVAGWSCRGHGLWLDPGQVRDGLRRRGGQDWREPSPASRPPTLIPPPQPLAHGGTYLTADLVAELLGWLG